MPRSRCERHRDFLLWVGFSDLSLDIDASDREVARSVEIEIRGEDLTLEAIDCAGVLLGELAVAHDLSHDCTVLAFDQRVVVGVSRPRVGEFDIEFVEHFGRFEADLFRAAIGVKAADGKREAFEHQADDRKPVRLAQMLDDDLLLCDDVYSMDVVDVFDPLVIALMDVIDADVARQALGCRTFLTPIVTDAFVFSTRVPSGKPHWI